MKVSLFIVSLAGVMATHALLARNAIPNPATEASVSACFVPAQDCVDQVVAGIASAKTSIHVQAYGFTSPPILQALVQAKQRGVEVMAILDKTNVAKRSRYSGATFVINGGIPVWIDSTVAIAHNKIVIIDNHLVIGGSYNYTPSAEKRNAENVTFIESPVNAALFEQNWESRKAVSTPYAASIPDNAPPAPE